MCQILIGVLEFGYSLHPFYKLHFIVHICNTICIQCVFLLWCMAPIQWNGSRVIYTKFIKPFVLRNEGKIDSTLDNITGQARTLLDQGVREGKHKNILELFCSYTYAKHEYTLTHTHSQLSELSKSNTVYMYTVCIVL